MSAILFLYRDELRRELAWLNNVVRARRPERLPVVLTRSEVATILKGMGGTSRLMASLLYGAGLRVLECAQLRVKDIDLERREILIRDGKGRKDRITLLPAALQDSLRVYSGKRANARSVFESGRTMAKMPDGVGSPASHSPPRGP